MLFDDGSGLDFRSTSMIPEDYSREVAIHSGARPQGRKVDSLGFEAWATRSPDAIR
jgi:hypothetical protein